MLLANDDRLHSAFDFNSGNLMVKLKLLMALFCDSDSALKFSLVLRFYTPFVQLFGKAVDFTLTNADLFMDTADCIDETLSRPFGQIQTTDLLSDFKSDAGDFTFQPGQFSILFATK